MTAKQSYLKKSWPYMAGWPSLFHVWWDAHEILELRKGKAVAKGGVE